MSRVRQCPKCGGNIVEPAYPGDGAYPVAPMCECVNGQAPYWGSCGGRLMTRAERSDYLKKRGIDWKDR